jgi:hypothetical protein
MKSLNNLYTHRDKPDISSWIPHISRDLDYLDHLCFLGLVCFWNTDIFPPPSLFKFRSGPNTDLLGRRWFLVLGYKTKKAQVIEIVHAYDWISFFAWSPWTIFIHTGTNQIYYRFFLVVMASLSGLSRWCRQLAPWSLLIWGIQLEAYKTKKAQVIEIVHAYDWISFFAWSPWTIFIHTYSNFAVAQTPIF